MTPDAMLQIARDLKGDGKDLYRLAVADVIETAAIGHTLCDCPKLPCDAWTNGLLLAITWREAACATGW